MESEMVKDCGSECHKTASINGQAGSRIMVAVEGNKKYPAGTPHPQCPECAASEYQGILADIQKLKDKSALGPSLSAEWERLQAKTKKVLDGSKK